MTTEFETYFTERRRALLRFATVLVGDPARADEIVADVLGRVFEMEPRRRGGRGVTLRSPFQLRLKRQSASFWHSQENASG